MHPYRSQTEEESAKTPTAEELMSVLGELTGWGEQAVVELNYKTVYIGDSRIAERHFVVSTVLHGEVARCPRIFANGPDLPQALTALAREIDRKLGLIACDATSRAHKTHRRWIDFLNPFS